MFLVDILNLVSDALCLRNISEKWLKLIQQMIKGNTVLLRTVLWLFLLAGLSTLERRVWFSLVIFVTDKSFVVPTQNYSKSKLKTSREKYL